MPSTSLGSLFYEVGADISKLVTNTNEVNTHLTKMEAFAGRVGNTFKAMFAGLSVAELGRELGTFLSESVNEFAAAEMSAVRLGAAVRAQGMEVPIVREHYLGLAEALQATTVYEHEAAEAAETMLIQIGGVLPSQMDRALKATADLAAGMGKDLPEAGMAVAKAFAGSTKELARLMPELKELQKDGLTAAEVLGVIEKHFGGQAAAQVDTYSGSIKQLGNSWKEVKEAIGEAIATDADVKKWVQSTKDSVMQFADLIKQLGLKRAASVEMTGMGPVAGVEGMVWSLLQDYLGGSSGRRGDIELKEDPKAKQARLDAAEQHKRAEIAATEHAARMKALREEYLRFGEDANRVLAQAAQGMEYLDRMSREALDALTKVEEAQRAGMAALGLTSPGDERTKAEQDAKAWREQQYKDLREAQAYGMPEAQVHEREQTIEAEYQQKLREAYEKWIASATAATDATNQLTNATKNLSSAFGGGTNTEGAGRPGGPGGYLIPGFGNSPSMADALMYGATLDTMMMGNGPNRDAVIATKLAGKDMSGLGRGGFTVNVHQTMPFNNDPASLAGLQRIIDEAIQQALARLGMH